MIRHSATEEGTSNTDASTAEAGSPSAAISGEEDHTDHSTGTVVSRQPPRRHGITQRYCLNLSARFLSTVFSFAAIRSHGGWKAQLWTYKIVPFDAEIFQYCRVGDMDGVRRLIDSGEASPLDRWADTDWNGATMYTTLEVSCLYQSLTRWNEGLTEHGKLGRR
jgi:hypothetical protein